MSWATQNLRPASFRGVPFEVDSDERSAGRRVEVTEFAKRDRPAFEDFGAKLRRLSIEAVLVGDDAVAQAARLEQALCQPGSGILIHPWYGELTIVVVDEVRTRHVAREGRVARISFACVEIGDATAYPTATQDTSARVYDTRTAALDALSRDFQRGYRMGGAPDWAGELIAGRVRSLGPVLIDAASRSGLLDGPAGAVADQAARLSSGTGIDIVSSSGLAARIFDALASLRGSGSRSTDALYAVSSWSAAPTAIGTATPSRQQAAVAADALGRLVPAAAAIEAGGSAPDITWSSRDQAIAWRDRTSDQLADAAETVGAAGWDDSYRAIGTLRSAIVRDVNRRAAPLPRLSTTRLGRTIPSTLAAYRLDGDALDTLFDRADDITTRNRIAHPGFVPGGRDLEILS